MTSKGIKQSGIQISRNTEDNLEYFDALVRFETDDTETLAKLYSFPLYIPRQVIEDFLSRYELSNSFNASKSDILEFGTFNGAGTFSFGHFTTILEPQNLTEKLLLLTLLRGFHP